jgi:hypothetical protein
MCTVGYKQCDGKFYNPYTGKLIKDPIFCQPIFTPDNAVYDGKYFREVE